LPEEDTKYFGSFSDKSFKPTGKTILFVCETRKEVVEIEIELHDFFDVAVNPQFANRSKQTSTRFDVAGVIFGPCTEEIKKKISAANSGKNHPQFGVPSSEKTRKKISEALSGEKHPNYGKFGAAHNSSKAIIAIKPDGTELHFVSGIDSARELGINKGTLCYYLKTGNVLKKGKFKGWQFRYKNL